MYLVNVVERLSLRRPVERRETLNLQIFLWGKLISLMGTNIYNFVLSLYILKTTASGAFFSLSILAGMLPRVVLGPVAGTMADRFDRKKIVVGLDILSGLVVMSLVCISSIWGLKLVFIYITNLSLAIISAFFDTALSASVPNLVTDKKLMQITSYSNAVNSFSGIMGPILGGIIYGIVPINLFLVVNGLSFLLSAASETFIDFRLNCPPSDNKPGKSVLSLSVIQDDVREVLTFFKTKAELLTIMKYAVLLNFSIGACYSVIFPFIINHVLRMSPKQYGILEAAFPVGLLVSSIIIGKLPEKDKKLKGLSAGIALIGMSMILLGVPTIHNLGSFNQSILIMSYYTVILLVSAWALVLVNIPLNVTFQRMIPDHLRGRAMGVSHAISGGMGPLGIILAGMLIDVLPAYILLLVSGISYLVSAWLLLKNKYMQTY